MMKDDRHNGSKEGRGKRWRTLDCDSTTSPHICTHMHCTCTHITTTEHIYVSDINTPSTQYHWKTHTQLLIHTTAQQFTVQKHVQMAAMNVRTNLLCQMCPLKLWEVLDVPQVIMVIAALLATCSDSIGRLINILLKFFC